METSNITKTAENAYSESGAAGAPRHIDMTFLEQICPGNPEFYQEMLTAFRNESSRHIANVRIQLTENDMISVAKTAHAMKPIGSYIGVSNLTTLMAQLEASAHNCDNVGVTEIISRAETLLAGINSEIAEYLNCK